CDGLVKVSINIEVKIALIHLQHSMIYKRSERFNVDESDIYRILEYDNPNLTQKQVHAWWSILIKQEYIKNSADQLNSAEIFLKDHGYQILLSNYKERIKFFGFVTPFFKIIK
ncbi:9199_t:CDS:2, partial [Racocetra fulgida]